MTERHYCRRCMATCEPDVHGCCAKCERGAKCESCDSFTGLGEPCEDDCDCEACMEPCPGCAIRSTETDEHSCVKEPR